MSYVNEDISLIGPIIKVKNKTNCLLVFQNILQNITYFTYYCTKCFSYLYLNFQKISPSTSGYVHSSDLSSEGKNNYGIDTVSLNNNNDVIIPIISDSHCFDV